VPDPETGPVVTLVCPQCAARLSVSIYADGAETLFQPQLLGEEAEAAMPAHDPSATIVIGPGTAVLGPEVAEALSVATVLQAALILAGAEPGSERFTLSAARTSVGRENADIIIADPALSSRHFEIEIRGSEYFLRDLGSSNGTQLNGDPIRASEISPGDTIQAGRSTFTFRTFEAISL